MYKLRIWIIRTTKVHIKSSTKLLLWLISERSSLRVTVLYFLLFGYRHWCCRFHFSTKCVWILCINLLLVCGALFLSLSLSLSSCAYVYEYDCVCLSLFELPFSILWNNISIDFFIHSLKHCVALRIKCANDDVNYYQQQQQQQQRKRRWRQQSQQQCILWDLITYWRVVYLHGQDKLVKAANGKIDQKPKWKRVSKQQRNHKFSPAANAKGRWIVNTWLNRTNKPKYRPMENE